MPSSNTYTNRVAFIASKEPLVNLLLVRRVRQDLASPALYLIVRKILPQPSRMRFGDFKHLIVLMLRQLAPVPFKHKAFRQTLVVPHPVAIKKVVGVFALPDALQLWHALFRNLWRCQIIFNGGFDHVFDVLVKGHALPAQLSDKKLSIITTITIVL